ncbi:MAG TPA: hypothetical protein VKD67_09400 [Acidimicrobiales bacterium]|nr:hypothetical protein [Acidimicrobiales bacterium]
MNAAVRRLLDQRDAQGFGPHVDDDGVLAQVVQLLDSSDARTRDDWSSET